MRASRFSSVQKFAAALLGAVCIALPAGAQQAPKLGPTLALGGGEYSIGGGLTVAVELREIGGKTVLCGVWAESHRLSAYVRGSARRVLSKATIALDGKALTHNVNFLRRAEPAESYAGASAGCVQLNRPWQTGDDARALEVWIPRQQLLFDRSGRKGSAQRITFGPSRSDNPALLKGSLLPAWVTHFEPEPGTN